MLEIKSFAEAHLKMYRCACNDADLIFQVGNGGVSVICKNCDEKTGTYANPDRAYWEWVNTHQYSTEDLLEKIIDEFEK